MTDLMEKEVSKDYVHNAAFTQYIAAFIGILILVLICVQIVIPQVSSSITNGYLASMNVSASTITMLGLLPLLIVVTLILLVLGIVKI